MISNRKPLSLIRFLATGAALMSACILGTCSFAPSEDTGGTGSEIVGKTQYSDSAVMSKNAVLPKVLTAAGLPVINGKVFVYSNTFIPDTSWAAVGASPKVLTDTGGNFRVFDVPRGLCFVEANDGGGSGIVGTVFVDRDSTTYDAGILTVKKTGSFKIQAHTSLPGRVRFYVSVKGTRCVVRGTLAYVDVFLDDIPTGVPFTINIRVYEPIQLEQNLHNIVIPVNGIADLGSFIIQK